MVAARARPPVSMVGHCFLCVVCWSVDRVWYLPQVLVLVDVVVAIARARFWREGGRHYTWQIFGGRRRADIWREEGMAIVCNSTHVAKFRREMAEIWREKRKHENLPLGSLKTFHLDLRKPSTWDLWIFASRQKESQK